MTRLEYLHEVKRLLPPNPICCEIGVYTGEFSIMIWRELNPLHLTLIDPFETGEEKYPDGLPTAYSDKTQLENLEKYFGWSLVQDRVLIIPKYSYDAVHLFPDNHFDFIYLDGCHTYDCVGSDLRNYLPKLKAGSIIGGHDYGSVFEGVKKAVDEFCMEYNFEIKILNPDGGDFALMRK